MIPSAPCCRCRRDTGPPVQADPVGSGSGLDAVGCGSDAGLDVGAGGGAGSSSVTTTSGFGCCSGSCSFTGATGAAVVGLGSGGTGATGAALGWLGFWRHSRGRRRRRGFLFGHHQFGNCLDGLLLLRDEFYFRLDLRLDHDYRLTHIQLITGFWQRCRWCLRHGCSHGWLRFWRCSRWSHGSCGYHGGRGGLFSLPGVRQGRRRRHRGDTGRLKFDHGRGFHGCHSNNFGWYEFLRRCRGCHRQVAVGDHERRPLARHFSAQRPDAVYEVSIRFGGHQVCPGGGAGVGVARQNLHDANPAPHILHLDFITGYGFSSRWPVLPNSAQRRLR